MTIIDLSDIKEVQRLLEAAKNEAEKAAKIKSQFLANMSHELRTPLNGIIGFSDILKNTVLDKEQKEFVDTVHSSARHLSDVITDILDFSRIEAGKFELHPENASLKELVEKTVSIVRQRALQKGLTLSLSYGDHLPQTVFVDGPRLRQILLNLLSNAVKFTDKGSVQLTVKAVQRYPDSALLQFRVDDTGMGIKQEEQAKVFEPFHQTDMSSSKSAEGTGLGLAIIKEILEKMAHETQRGANQGTVPEIGGKGRARLHNLPSTPVLCLNPRNDPGLSPPKQWHADSTLWHAQTDCW